MKHLNTLSTCKQEKHAKVSFLFFFISHDIIELLAALSAAKAKVANYIFFKHSYTRSMNLARQLNRHVIIIGLPDP